MSSDPKVKKSKKSKKSKRKVEEIEAAVQPAATKKVKKSKKAKKEKVAVEPVVAEPVVAKKAKKSKKSKKAKKEAAPEPVVAKKVKKSKKDKKKKKEKKEPVVEATPEVAETAAAEEPAKEAAPVDDFMAGLKKKNKYQEQQEANANLEEITLTCRDCQEGFPFTVEDQQWHIDQGFDNQPSRCKPCQRAKKERMNGGPPQCYAFAEGNCSYGDDCRFAHGNSGGGGGRGGRGRGRGGRGRGRGGGGKCYAFADGNCSYGDNCRFSHE